MKFIRSQFPKGEEGFLNMLIKNDLEFISAEKSPKKVDFFQERTELKALEISHCLIFLAKIAQMPFKEIKGQDFLEGKWKEAYENVLTETEKEQLRSKYLKFI